MQDLLVDLQAVAKSLGNKSLFLFETTDSQNMQNTSFGSRSKKIEYLKSAEARIEKFEGNIKILRDEVDSFCIQPSSTNSRETLSTLHIESTKTIEKDISFIQTTLNKISFSATKMKDSTQQRIILNKVTFLRERFVQLLQEYIHIERAIREKLKESFKCKLAFLKPNINFEKLEDLENVEPGIQQIEITLTSIDTKELINQLDTETAILDQLNRNLTELYRIFNEFAILVQSQEETINSIERALESTTAKVQEGVRQLKLARKYKGRQRIKALIVTLISFFVGAAAATTIALKLGLGVVGTL